ncbi:cytokine receptor isoform X3 [Folsomia candida]|uniref:cytokine receptor isoform X3 n=1 Tax=Folsomia candida TaxID=158441 RepID=UPI000B8F89A1|nr:cytokine receptor isoform X3 [Folsomia candida]
MRDNRDDLLYTSSHGFKKGGIKILYLSLLLLFLVIFVSPAWGEDDVDLVCQKGVSGFRGATFPRGDILLKEGDTLEVYCRLDMAKAKPYNASFIQFRFTKTNISEGLMKTTVINETTALLRVERMNVSSPHLSCEIVPPGSRRIQVCQNEIDVGYPPLPVENFSCIAQDWRSLNCTWKKPYNPIPTSYSLQILQKGKSFNSIVSCPNATATPTSCVWGPRTEPFYRQNQNPLHFRINGTNVLNPKGSTWNFSIEHWSIVVPEAPSDLKIVHSLPDVATVWWAFKSFKDFVPGLVHQVTVCIQNASVACNVTKLNSYKGSGHLEHNISLDYAYVNYTIEIKMRSQRARDEASFWSKPGMIVVASSAKSPTAPPKVDVGSYESVPMNDKKRDILVYWEDVDPLFRNGPGFHYIHSVQEDEEKKEDIQPKETNRSYAKFSGLWLNKSYRFQIVSANDEGNSSASSVVFVPRIPKGFCKTVMDYASPKSPTAVSQLDFNNGSFIISWNPVNPVAVPIVSYTVFRCISTKPRPQQCQGLMKWDVVSADKQSKFYNNLPHNNMIYQFAVAANAENMSSGMAWASCTLIHGRVPDKLKKVEKILEAEKEIHIKWSLDCSYKPGVIEGYKISYCRVEDERNKTGRCIDNEKQEAVAGSEITTYHLKKLYPCATYMISVSIISANGESQKSEPIYATTKPSAPSYPPIVSEVTVTNTSATISIKPQFPLNGIIKEYRVKYKSLETGEATEKFYPVAHPSRSSGSSENSVRTDSCFDDGAVMKLTEVEVKNLLSNSNYSFTVAACTSKCSEDSTLAHFKTDVGYTDMTTFPDMHIDGDDIAVVWSVPSNIRGPITKFEILLKQNGKDDDIVSVPYDGNANASTYYHKMKFSCETSTNLTAQVRAVTVLESRGETLYGRWSSAGNFNCGGGASWIVWVGVVIGVIVLIGLIGITSTKLHQKFKYMKEGVDVTLPPGMAVQSLNGFSHNLPKRRRDSGGDTHSFGKENLNYQLQMTTTHHSDDPKDFTSLNESCLQQEVENEHLLTEKRLSECPTNPLLDDSLTTDDTEEDAFPIPISYSNLPAQDLFDDPGFGGSTSDNGSPVPFSNSPYPTTVSIGGGSSPSPPPPSRILNMGPNPNDRAPPSSNNNGSLSLPTNPVNSPYVKWTQVMPDQFMNGDGSISGGDHTHKAPYCQVGILLDSN